MKIPPSGPNILILSESDAIRAQLRDCIHASISPCTLFEETDSQAAIFVLEQHPIHLMIIEAKIVKAGELAILRVIPSLEPDRRPQFVFLLSENFTAPAVYSPRARVSPFPVPISTETLCEQIKIRLLPKSPIPQAPKLDIQVFDICERAVSLVFQKLVGIDIKRTRAYLRKKDLLTGDIAGLIQLKSPHFDGHMCIAMHAPLFLHGVNKMLGTDFTEITTDCADAIAEVCNQVYGFAKRELNTLSYNLEPSIPSIVQKEQCSFRPPENLELHICMEFSPTALLAPLDAQKIVLEIQLKDLTQLKVDRSRPPTSIPTSV